MSFWQTGFEIYGQEEGEANSEALKTLVNCFQSCNCSNAYYRISDKRILKGLILDLPLNQQRDIYYLIDQCHEDGTVFEKIYKNNGGNEVLAGKIGALLNLGKEKNLTLDMLKDFTNNSFSYRGVENIKAVVDNIGLEFPNINIQIIPFMGKSWDACDKILFDVRLPDYDYDYAVAGGGNLCAFNKKDIIQKSGAGIGVTRLTEYILEKQKKDEFEDKESENSYAV